MRTSELYASGCLEEPGDLLQDAFEKALSGQRRCPADVTVVVFLKNTMRSLADNARKRREREPTDAGQSEDCEPSLVPVLESDAGDLVAYRKRLEDLFADDPIAERVVRGMLDGLKGAALRDSCRLGEREYQTVRRRIRRRLERARKEGWL